MSKMVNYHDGEGIFNLRCAGVAVRNADEVLLCYYPKPDLWSLPGGRCNLHETASAALKREFMEEMNEEVKVGKLLWIIENIFEHKGEKWHEILFVFLVEFSENSKAMQLDEFNAHEGDLLMPCKWVKTYDLYKYNLLPRLFIDKLGKIPNNTEHIVNKE